MIFKGISKWNGVDLITDITEAIGYVSPTMAGCCKPHILSCDDGKNYVVKFINNPQGTKAIINEYICYRVAFEINLPVPKFKIISISQDLIEIEENLTKVQCGLHFGCEYLSKSVDFVGQNMLKSVINISDIAGILAFDFWVGNDDRTSNNGNLLINQESSTSSKIFMIDHTHCFTDGPHWTAEDLCLMSEVSIIPFDGEVYCQLIKKINSQECFESWLSQIESFDDNLIKEIINDVPEQWGLKENEKDALFSYLSLRKTDVRPAIMSQRSKFPKWKVVN